MGEALRPFAIPILGLLAMMVAVVAWYFVYVIETREEKKRVAATKAEAEEQLVRKP